MKYRLKNYDETEQKFLCFIGSPLVYYMLI